MESLPSNSKKLAAIIAAVLQHVAETEVPATLPAGTPSPGLPPPPSGWGMAGRQDAMLLRNLWQRRLSKSW